jgi:hypothetical protein
MSAYDKTIPIQQQAIKDAEEFLAASKTAHTTTGAHAATAVALQGLLALALGAAKESLARDENWAAREEQERKQDEADEAARQAGIGMGVAKPWPPAPQFGEGKSYER